ncbi:MAG: hypothetical protein JWO05_1766 [Gemmatimonadetes bacterium]|nr:hypothetical protein [Gemmatimonadota bacterium]
MAAASAPSLVILGADVVRAAHPATPIQLAHACVASGWHSVVPPNWGDELVARAAATWAANAPSRVAIQCACPLVSERLLAAGGELGPWMLSLVSPPVAAARYLRAACAPAQPRITYAGNCPGARSIEIDEQLTVDEFLTRLVDEGIDVRAQPTVFDGVLPPDRRRFFSLPGGLPSMEGLRAENAPHALVELQGSAFEVELAQVLLAQRPAIVDLACAVGCVCAGAGRGIGASDARRAVMHDEPPRATTPVVQHDLPIALVRSLPVDGGAPSLPRRAPVAERAMVMPTVRLERMENEGGVEHAAHGEPMVHAERADRVEAADEPAPPRRRSSPGIGTPRAVLGAMPLSRSEDGRQLPRAYVARRRSSPRGMRLVEPRSGEPFTSPPPAASAVGSEAPERSEAPTSRRLVLVLVVAIVVVATIALAMR